jgi:Na+-transporting NADH:ubiquinone oxidoreductase subunit E
MIVEKYATSIVQFLGIFLPLIAVNCSILGGALFMQEREYASLGEATVFAFGSVCDGSLAIVALSAYEKNYDILMFLAL